MTPIPGDLLLIDLSNSFAKIARASGEEMGPVFRVPTRELTAARIRDTIGPGDFTSCVYCSVVPEREEAIRELAADHRIVRIDSQSDHRLAIEIPEPAKLGADRLVNAAFAAAHYAPPVVVVDLGTAATFDVVLPGARYVGGVIAPGLEAMTNYLHDRTALLPRIDLREPVAAIGKTTEQAMQSGAIIGYRGLVRGILDRLRREVAPHGKLQVVATGGYTEMFPEELPEVVPNLTMEGLLLLARWSC